MKNLLLISILISFSVYAQMPVSDKYMFGYENGSTYKCGPEDRVEKYGIPFIPKFVPVDFKVETLEQPLIEFGETYWTKNSRVRVNVKPKNGYFFLDDNSFNDNYRVAIIQSGNYDNLAVRKESSYGYGYSTVVKMEVPFLSFIFTKSDKSSLMLRIHSDIEYAPNQSPDDIRVLEPGVLTIKKAASNITIDLIFDGDPTTKIKIDQEYLAGKEIDSKSKIISSLKKHSYVDVRISNIKTGDNYFRKVSLKGSTSALNKIINTKIKPSSKNQFEYKYNMGLSNMNAFDYEGYIYKFIEDAKKNHGLNFDYAKKSILTVSKRLDDNIIAVALASDDDNSVVIAIDPESWSKASQAKRWYIIYHELGHDILNLEHGECGPMMNPYAKNDYSWDEVERDKGTMFEMYKSLKQK